MTFLNSDFKDFIESLNRYLVDYVLVGGYAVVLRGYNRSTGDIDILVRKTEDNYSKLTSAFHHFGLPENAILKERFLSADFDVFSFGRPPLAIDIMTSIKGLNFEEVYQSAEWVKFSGINIRLINLDHLIIAKRNSGRFKDLDDIENLPKPKSGL